MASTIRARAEVDGGVTTVKALIQHPMETGRRRDPRTGKLVPAHFIREVTARHDDSIVFHAAWGTGISKDPYVAFRFKGAHPGDRIRIDWVDNLGDADAIETQVE